MINEWLWKQCIVAFFVVAGWGLSAASAADGLAPCQTGMVLVVPHGEPGSRVERFVTPDNGPSTVETRATVKWDETALTVIIDCADTNILAVHSQHDDVEMWRDDYVEVFLDVGHIHEDGWLRIQVSAALGVCDARGSSPVYDACGGDPRYRMLEVLNKTLVERTAGGWRATVVMTWKGIGAKPRPGDVWGFNLNRENQPEREYLCWAPTARGFVNIHEWGHIVFAPPVGTGAVDGMSNTLASIARKHAEVRQIIKARAGREKKALVVPKGEQGARVEQFLTPKRERVTVGTCATSEMG